MRRALSSVLLAMAVTGCQSKTPEPANHPLGQAPAAAPMTSDGLTGPVIEQLNAPPYIYIRVKTSKGEVWAAVPQAKIENGAVVTVFNPMLMSKFESKSLKRVFDEVYFGTLAPTNAEASGPAGASPAGAPQPAAQVAVGKVEKADGADALTVSELWARKASLVGKTVSIRGTVVKYNQGVMGKNWIHLQDGSGDAKQGTHDITVTSLDGTAMGATITIKGTVRTNKDFGAGYSYAVIVEDAKVVRK
jgi:VCBS repeat-containing protein